MITKRLLKPAMIACASLFCMGAPSANADIIFNSLDGLNQTANSFTTTGSNPRNYMADDLSTIALANSANDWLVDSLSVRVFVAGSGTAGVNLDYTGVTMRIRVYNDVDLAAAAGTSIFSNIASDVIWNLGTVTNSSTTGGAQVFTYNLDYLAQDLDFLLDDGQNMGVAVELLSNGLVNNGLATALRNVVGDPGLPSVGTSTNGWYRDVNGNGIIEANERRTLTGTNSNIHLLINATEFSAIPEPSGLGIFALGSVLVAGVAARRRKV